MNQTEHPQISPFKKGLFFTAGLLCVLLATLGLVLPLVPTTPFLLLAAACFLRSSERFHNWLINHRIFGSYIRNYREKGGLTLRHKIVSITVLWVVILYSTFFALPIVWLIPLPLLVAAWVTRHLLKMPTVDDSNTDDSEQVD